MGKVFKAAPQRILVAQDRKDSAPDGVVVEYSGSDKLSSGIVQEVGEMFPEIFGTPPLTKELMEAFEKWNAHVGGVIRRNYSFKKGDRIWFARAEASKIFYDGIEMMAVHWKDVECSETDDDDDAIV